MPAAGAYGTVRTATATVTKASGTPIGDVIFTLDGTTSPAVPLNGEGKATWALPGTLAVGGHSVSASYGGDTTTDPSVSAAATVTVAKVGSTLTSAKPKVKVKKKAKKAKKAVFTVVVHAPAGASPAGTVTLTVKGKGKVKKVSKRKTTSVGANGVAKVKIKGLKRGKYKATWSYAGSATVAPGTVKVKKFKV